METETYSYLVYFNFEEQKLTDSFIEGISENYVFKKVNNGLIIVISVQKEQTKDVFEKITKNIKAEINDSNDIIVVELKKFYGNLPNSIWAWLSEKTKKVDFIDPKKNNN